MKYTIYYLVDSRTSEPFYVGSTIQPLYMRLALHRSRSKDSYYGRSAVNARIREIHEDGAEVLIEPFDYAPDVETARLLEAENVQECNVHYGEAPSVFRGGKRSKEFRNRVSNGVKQYYSENPMGHKDEIAKEWIVITPDGSRLEILNLRRFAEENGIKRETLYDSARRGTTTRTGYKVLRKD